MLIQSLFYVDTLSIILISLVLFLGLSIGCFAKQYLITDQNRRSFFCYLILLIVSICVMAIADNCFLFAITSLGANLLLARLLMHKKKWPAARASAFLTARYLFGGFVCLTIALGLLAGHAHTFSIQTMLKQTSLSDTGMIASLFLLATAVCQSALWPCHKWLISSLNSPTPVSAMMHAGVINGGGFLLARFAPILVHQPHVLLLTFMVGGITAIIGSFWKLIQSDVKRMLACSTMAQMGFMIMQCGLGLFPAAIAHLCWHGLFKASAFLQAGSAARENRLDLTTSNVTLMECALALLFSCVSVAVFSWVSHTAFTVKDTRLFLITLAWLSSLQVAIAVIKTKQPYSLFLSSMISAMVAALYGLSVRGMEYLLTPLHIARPQPITWLHTLGLSLFVMSWIVLSVMKNKDHPKRWQKTLSRYYARLLNASQPHHLTITTNRNEYQH